MHGNLAVMTNTLRTCPLGVDIEICKIDIDARFAFRLNEMGLREHERVRVLHKANFGGCVIAHGMERIALDGDTAKKIFVETR